MVTRDNTIFPDLNERKFDVKTWFNAEKLKQIP
jgi:hypothetical protein